MRSLPTLLIAVSLVAAPAREAQAYPSEADGWGGIRWGDSVKTLMKRRQGIRQKGYRLGKVTSSLRRSEGGIFLDETTATYGQDEAGIRWFVRKGQGVFKVEISLQDSNPMTELSGRSIRGVVTDAHGPGGVDRERRAVWPGKRTVIEVDAPRMLTGANVIITHTRRSEWEGTEAELDLPDSWGSEDETDKPDAAADPAPAAAPRPAVKSAPAPERTTTNSDKGPSAVERAQAEAAARVDASKGVVADNKAAKKAAMAHEELPEIREAESLLDPSVE